MIINYPPYFAIINNDESDVAMIFNFQPDASSVAGAADFRFKSLGQAFKLNGMEADAAFGTSSSSIATITGYLAGNPVTGASGTINLSASTATNGGITYRNNGIGGNGGRLTFNTNWQNLDEIRITGTNLLFGIDDLEFSPAVTGTLPIALSLFKAIRLNENQVQLTWRTKWN